MSQTTQAQKEQQLKEQQKEQQQQQLALPVAPALPAGAADLRELLKGTDRYNPTHIERLEKYIQEQVTDGTYDFESNLALLRLYQFHPTKVNADASAQVLLKMLLVLPAGDYASSLFLLSDKLQADESIKNIVAAAHHLEAAQFIQFWSLVNATPKIKQLMPSFADEARKFIAHILSVSAQSMDQLLLSKFLDLQAGAFDSFVAAQGWAVERDAVSFGVNKDNQAKSKNISEKIPFNNLTKLLGQAFA
ncbi:hypothetical protein CAOG_06910 [Capsaspora owczarzaki ATCC 30864]|uniref:Eukaryotic translation initiation factor 3 subunit K n=1 Tax=Capsaspora owczarzaki (strain ATCC 30864) TaxID=595528 RepID=A0A0D2WV50_CAPO3|nr:hypothetical protein CAOG_06910 [Capsaspora owczarzaki ATCC 30864]KJE96610.1 hypothetical protein CAOG_006910 [Capsaspora owczarzaki ATCC 30864]|eukprot:XP_004344531.1 hypothetical protein CAOG_06910 [Capsaspora owczarzaki ATCC 30864]